jgi:hypothetical protein
MVVSILLAESVLFTKKNWYQPSSSIAIELSSVTITIGKKTDSMMISTGTNQKVAIS